MALVKVIGTSYWYILYAVHAERKLGCACAEYTAVCLLYGLSVILYTVGNSSGF